MKRNLLILALIVLTVGLLGSCETLSVPVTGVTLEADELMIIVKSGLPAGALLCPPCHGIEIINTQLQHQILPRQA